MFRGRRKPTPTRKRDDVTPTDTMHTVARLEAIADRFDGAYARWERLLDEWEPSLHRDAEGSEDG